MITLKLLPPLTRLVGAKVIRVDVDRAPLHAVLERALSENEKLRTAVSDEGGEPSNEYACVVNGQRYNMSEPGDIVVGSADEITILLPLAGG